MPRRDIARPLRERAQWIDEALTAPLDQLSPEQIEYRQRIAFERRARRLDVLFGEAWDRGFAKQPPYEERIPIW